MKSRSTPVGPWSARCLEAALLEVIAPRFRVLYERHWAQLPAWDVGPFFRLSDSPNFMADSDYDVFREQPELAIKYPSYGHALWEPSPRKQDRPVQVGDVGFIRNDRFYSLFNVLRPAEGQSNVPDCYEQLCPKFSDHISNSSFGSSHYSSAGISVEPEPDFHASSPDYFRQVLLTPTRRRGGAELSLPAKARCEDTPAKGDFGEWIVKHIDRWFAFARGLGLGIEKMEEIILVTGCDRTRSWTNVAFLGNDTEYDTPATFGAEVNQSPAIDIKWPSSPEHVQNGVVHQGYDGTSLPEDESGDQCMSIRGFRVMRTFRTLPKQPKAAANPSPDPDSYDFEPDIEVVSDPLNILLDYIAERAPDCDMYLFHDDDLKRINGIGDGSSVEALQSSVVMDHLRRSDMEVHAVQCDLSHTSSNSRSNTEVVKVAMTSLQNWNFAPQSQLLSLAAQRCTGLPHAPESTRQTTPGILPVPVIQSDTDSGRSNPIHKSEYALKYLVGLFSRLSWKLRGAFAHVHPVSIVVFACSFAFTWVIYSRNVNIFAFAILLTINVLYMWFAYYFWRQSRDRLRRERGLHRRRETPRHYIMSNLAPTAPVDDARNSVA